ncbi:SpoVR family protein [candidate division KSB1 bacterium]|nr:SpoVR family protein [candidate division KSB1 bacterium]NIR73176.1 SpoVR family protein [candidate division KSB1 bacterium]NIS26946.1 SpoVR family protein [candidate division KSB1 bacterium]NIT73784.1 SpoVR family protein [candidate division KSB1 bacterium]NIU27690.1 SpoVR family protein [candidate division KSB1 bacterium]
MNIPEDLAKIKEEIEEYAESYKLDFFETIFEIVEFDELNEVASYGGFPTRYPHWRFGMDYEELSKGYTYGLQKIYELVINNDPCYAYLMKCNNLVDQKLVMAHVYAHCDFFKHNLWFAHTNRKMMDKMANNSTQIRRFMERYGEEPVEDFIEVCLSLENLIDPHSAYIKRKNEREDDTSDNGIDQSVPRKLKSKSYMDSFINPEEFLEEQKRISKERKEKEKRKHPLEPERDVLKFLLENAPLERWQADVLSIIREEAYYFAPQGQTKIMNEGWATYWHSKIMTEKVLTDAELIDYADHHSGTLMTGTGRLNPYKLGVELFRDIEDRWNKGKFGKEYEECDDWETKKNWDKKLGLGQKKIFEVRHMYNDLMFIDAFLTPEFCYEHKLFAYDYNDRNDMYEISSRQFKQIKEKLLFSLTNFGQPFIYVEDANYLNRGELYLSHKHEGVDLKLNEARDTLTNLFKIWSRPVHVETVLDESKTLLSFDGSEHHEVDID